MSKYVYEKEKITIKFPKCASCLRYKKRNCKAYPKGIPKEIQFEFKDCEYYLKNK